MAVIVETPNPFQPLIGIRKHVHSGGISIRSWLQETYPGFVEFGSPTVCLLNGKPLLRKDWDHKIESKDIINFIAIAGEVVTIIAIIVAVIIIALSVALALSMGKPSTGELPASDPVWSTKGQTNEIRLGEPIEVNYGRNRIYPSLASRSFFLYQNNDQYQHSLFCIGQGVYDIQTLQIGNTPITSFSEVESEIIEPGGTPSLFGTNIQTSLEVGGQTLFGPNEDSYVAPGWIGPFTVCDPNEVVSKIDVDFVYPKGLYSTDSKGNLHSVSVITEVEARLIDNTGAPLGSFFLLLNPIETGATTTPQRRTYSTGTLGTGYGSQLILNAGAGDPTLFAIGATEPHPPHGMLLNTVVRFTGTLPPQLLPATDYYVLIIHNTGWDNTISFRLAATPSGTPISITPGSYNILMTTTGVVGLVVGRYEVRARRTSNTSLDYRVGNDVIWESMRGYVVGDAPDFGNVTLWAVKVRATSNLNNRTQDRFNVIATRKLPMRDPSSGLFGEPIATRSIIWAFVDVFRSVYGGRLTDDKFYDWDTLYDLDALYEFRNDHFDWIIRDRMTVWDAATMIARVGRAVPLLSGSQITIRRDGPLSVPVAMFTPENIVKGSFEWDIKLWDLDEFDSASIEYTDPDTGYLQEHVLCILPGDTSDTPEDVRFMGIQNRDHAYREGLYYLASKRYLRENITFDTGMEGFLPSFGDLIAVSHDVPEWGQSGYVLAAEFESTGVYNISVSEPLNFDESGQEYQIMLRDRHGQVIGPMPVFPTSDSKIVTIEPGTEIDFLLGGKNEPMIFLFGVQGNITKYGRVVKLEPQGGEKVKITMVNEAEIIHSFDGLSAPPLSLPALPPLTPDAPIISALYLSQVDNVEVTIQALWFASFGAISYLVDTSQDNVNWTRRAETIHTSIQLRTSAGITYVRVAALGNAQGPWIQGSILVSLVFGLSNPIPWVALEWKITWWEELNIGAYLIKVYDDTTESLPVLKRTVQQSNTDFTYDWAMAIIDGNVVRDMLVSVDTMIVDDTTGDLVVTGSPRTLKLHNPIPSPPLHLDSVLVGETSDGSALIFHLSWDNPAEDDLIRYAVWVSEVNGFDPSVVSPMVDETVSTPGYVHIPQDAFVEVPIDSGGDFPIHYWRVGLFDVWGNEISTNLSEESILALPWILDTGHWNDLGIWNNTANWQDS